MSNLDAMAEFFRVLNVPFTFSINCRSGVLPACGCWRCRGERGEPSSEETEEAARREAERVDRERVEEVGLGAGPGRPGPAQ